MNTQKEEIINSFETAYNGMPPWDIGRPQREIVKLEAAGEIYGQVLDVGCGTGELVTYLMKKGYAVVGIDISSVAIDKARKKAQERGLNGSFFVHDALHLETIGLKFDTIIDSGLFHVFSDGARTKFVNSIKSVLRKGGKYVMICFSEHEPPGWGPRRVTRTEIQYAFKKGFHINYIREALFEANHSQKEIKAWLTSITKL